MAGKTESTMTWKLDIKDLKAGMQEARRAISQANAEFKKSTAGMDSWGKSTDGVKAKITQLKTVLTNQKTILEQLNKQYDITAKEMGEDSAEAQKLKTQITNQEAAIKKTEASIKNYNSKLNDMEAEEKEANSATGKLTKEIEEQQKKVDDLKKAYKESLVGKNPEEAKKLKKELKNASDELSKSKSKMNDADRAADKLAGSLDKSSDKAKQAAKGGFTVLKGALANLVSQGISKVTSAITENLDGAIERVDTLNAYKRTMENLGYATEDVADAQQKLKDGVQGLPTTLPQIVSMQKQYAALTGDLGKSTDLTLALNNATLAAGAGADEASRAAEHWYKIISAGKPELENWKEINSIMPAQMNQIAESIMGAGKKANDLRDAWKGGTVTTEQVMDALIKLDKEGGGKLASFSQQAQDASGGIGTSLTNIKVAIQTQLANMIEAIGVDKISAALGKVKEYVGIVGKAVTDKIKEMMPKIKEIIKVVIDNKDKIIKALGLIAAAIATAFVVKKVFDFITALKGLASMLNTVLGVIKNIFITNPWLLLIAGIAAAVAAIVIFIKKSDEAKRAQYQLTEEQKKQIDVINENADAYKELNDSRNKAMDDTVSEYNHLESLINEYNAHVDANGKVQDSYKGRADFILNELAKAFGMEVDEIKKLIDENGKLGESIQNVLNLKRAEALLNANQEAYNTAIKEQMNAWNDLAAAKDLVNEKQRDYNKALAEFEAKGGNGGRAERLRLEGAKEALDQAREAVHNAEDAWKGYNQTIQNYEGLGAAIQSKDANKIAEAMATIRYNILTAENADRESLERQYRDFQETYEKMKQAAQEEGSGVTDTMVEEMGNAVHKAGDELSKLTPMFEKEGDKAGDGYVKALNADKSKSNKAGGELGKEGVKGANGAGNLFTQAGKAGSGKYSSGLLAGKSDAYRKAYQVALAGGEGFKANNPYPAGSQDAKDYDEGILAGKKQAETNAAIVADWAQDGFESKSAWDIGHNLTVGFADGIKDPTDLVWDAASSMVDLGLAAMRKAGLVKSPSRATMKIGDFMSQGLAVGIKQGFKGVISASESLANTTIDAMAEALGIHSPSTVARDKIGKNIAQGVVDGLNASQKVTQNALQKNINNWWRQVDNLNKQKSKTSNKTTKKNLQKQIDNLKKKITTAQKDIGNLYKQYNSSLIERAQSRVSDLEKYDRITLEQEVTYWEKIVKSLKKGARGYSKAYSEATGELKLAKRAYNEYLVQKDNDSVSNLQNYISRMESLDKISLKNEETLWKNKIKTLKKGSEAYKTAEVELYQVRKAIAEQETQKQNDSVSNLQAYISRMNNLDKMSVKREVELWQSKIKTLKKGSEAYQEAEVELYQARKALAEQETSKYSESVSNLQSYISRMNSLDKMSAQKEVALWEKKIATLKKGTQAYKTAEVELYQAKKALAEQETSKYSESVSNLQSYISRMNSLDRMTAQKEVALWEAKIKTLKKGTQAYKDAEVELYQAKKRLADDQTSAAQDSLSDLQSYISRMNSLDKMSLKKEVELWEARIKTLKKGTDAYKTAEVELYQARKALNASIVSDAQSRISYLQSLDKITAAEELKYWDGIIKNVQKGTDAYQTAEVELYKAKKGIITSTKDLTANFTSSVAKLKSELSDNIKEIKSNLSDNIKSLKETLTTEIANVMKTYTDAIASRTDTLKNAWGGLFNSINLSPKVTSGKLTENLQLQVDALKAYDKTLASLEKKLGTNSELVAELREQGVESLHTMQSLDEMSTQELANYVSLYEQRTKIATKRATTENATLKKETEAQVAELKKSTNADIAELQKEANAQIKELQDNANKEIKTLTQTFKDGLKELGVSVSASSKTVGNAITSGISAGIQDGMKDVTGTLKKEVQGLVDTVKVELKIKSPSRVFRDEIGKMLPPGIAAGFTIAMPAAESEMQKALRGAVEDLKQTVEGSASNIIPFTAASGAGVGDVNNQVVNFNQTINSPKAVDRLTLYRQTNSLLFGAKVRLSNV